MRNFKKIFSSAVVSIVIACVMFLGLAYLFVAGLIRCITYSRYMEDPIYVDAVVTEYEEYWDSDEGGNVYEVYVSYTIDNETFPRVYYLQENSKEELVAIGEHLSLIVDPQDHGKLYKNAMNAFMIISVDVIFCMLIAAFLRDFRRRHLTAGLQSSVETAALEKDLHIIIRGRVARVLWLLLTILFGGFRLAFPLLFGKGYMIAAAVTGVFWLITMTNALIATYKVRHGMYTVHIDQLVKKDTGTDSDGAPVYRLYYESGSRRWDSSVSQAEYQRANVGATVVAVYLQGCSRPIMHYNHLGKADG